MGYFLGVALLRIGWLIITVFVYSPSAAIAGEFDFAWAGMAGEHLGRAEAAGSCPGFKINAGRRAQIVALYMNTSVVRNFEIERNSIRTEREAAIKQDQKAVCESLIAMYGPSGLAIRNYVLKSTDVDIPEQPGIDRGISLGVDPRGIVAIHWLGLSGVATAIETVCGSKYAMSPLVEGHHFLMGQMLGKKDAMLMAGASLLSAGKEYKLKEDRPGFCARILKDYGPDSRTPVVQPKSR